jgi:S-adenosylmethionine decarboxylase
VFFEGSEKKFEVVVDSHVEPLRQRPRKFWELLVKCSNAEIIGELKSSSCTAYLLSESSLFVWDDRITMITCGETTLANAVEFFINEVGPDHTQMLIFQRKNEFQSHLQKSSFFDDEDRLKKLMPGNSFCFGKRHEHHNLLFASHKEFLPPENDNTLELLMYDIDPQLLEVLTDPGTCLETTREILQLHTILREFELDDFCFEPFGYSLNALRGDTYATIHITPQKQSSYISYETNADLKESQKMLGHFLEVLRPGTFDLIQFNSDGENLVPQDYSLRTCTQKVLDCGYEVAFFHYFHKNTIVNEALELNKKEWL